MEKKKSIVLLIQIIVICIIIICGSSVSFADSEIIDRGTCGGEGTGRNLSWTLDSEGLLTITGNGIMYNYTSYTNSPWYSKNSMITSVMINEGVTSIGDYAFDRCSSLTDITIPESVTSIGNHAFYICSSLTDITIPDSVTSLGSSAFHGCSLLRNITIPDSVTSIESGLFGGCSSLTDITIPESVTRIGNQAFLGCGLTSITIPESVTSIGSETFRRCSLLTSVTIPESMTSLESGLFMECSSITDITIPDSVTSIGSAAFQQCRKLTSVTIPEGVTNLEDYTFAQCSSLASITIPDRVTSIGNGAFLGCGLTGITIPDSVTSIGQSAFQASRLTSITIPESVTSIGSEAFQRCSLLTSVTIPESVTSIESGLFYECKGLTSITIPNGVTSIGQSAFEGCSGLTSITIPDSVTSIGQSAFEECSGLTSITIPDSVTSIGQLAFLRCSSLTSITIPNSVTSIGASTFSRCSSLTSIMIPEGVTSIGPGAFTECSSLTGITIPNSVTSIDLWAFQDCKGLTSITLPDSLINLDNSAFNGCSNLININIGDNNTNYYSYDGILYKSDNSFIRCPEGKKGAIILSEETTKISDNAFYGCSGITSIMVSNGVTSIGNSAFYGCRGITSITIPNGVASIGNNAFYGCSSLTNIIINGVITSIGQKAFDNCYYLNTIYVQCESQGTVDYINENRSTINLRDECALELLHKDEIEGDLDPQPTCTAKGTKTFICPVCEEVLRTEEVPALGHSFTDYKVHFEKNSIGAYCDRGCGTYDVKEELTVEGSGICGENLEWKLLSDGTLYIYGTGPMYDYTSIYSEDPEPAPWSNLNFTNCVVGDGVTSIGANAFFVEPDADFGCEELTQITLPDSLTSIGGSAFQGCSKLTSIEIPDSVTEIGVSAFWNCSSLESVNIPEGITRLNSGLFVNCSSLKNIEIPNTVTDIGIGVFNSCSSLKEITIPNSVESIAEGILLGCESLEKISVPFLGSSIENDEEYDCLAYFFQMPPVEEDEYYSGDSVPEPLKEVKITGNVTSLGDGAFQGCNYLTKITLPDSLVNIGAWAFSGCSSLPTIRLPEGITEIGDGTFEGCFGLTSITIPKNVTDIGIMAFSACTSLESVSIPSEVTNIEEGAFANCNNLSRINVVDNNSAYYSVDGMLCDKRNNSLILCPKGKGGDIVIPDAITSIEEGAFAGCYKITSVTVSDSVISIGSDAFAPSPFDGEESNLTKAYVIKGSYADKNFDNIFDGVDKIYVYKDGEHYIYENITKEPTCTESGSKTLTCSVCGKKIKTESIPALGHDYVDTVIEPTTSAGGYTKHVCSRCGNTYTDNETNKIEKELNALNFDKERTIMCINCSMEISINNFENTEFTWKSNDTSIAKVSQDGVVTAVKPGKATISASNSDYYGKCIIEVGDYSYFGEQDAKYLQDQAPDATIQKIRIYAFTDSFGSDIVFVHINYEYGTDQTLDRVHNLTSGTVSNKGLEYYDIQVQSSDMGTKLDAMSSKADLGFAYLSILKGDCCYYDPNSKTDEDAGKSSGDEVKPSNEPTTTEETKPAKEPSENETTPSKETSADASKQMGSDGTAMGAGASAEAAEKALTSAKTDKDLKGSVYNKLQLKQSKVTKTAITMTWKKVSGAKKYVVYAGKSGKSNKIQKITTTSKTKYTLKKFNKKSLVKGTYYKFAVVALNSKGKVVSASKFAHVATLGKNAASNPAKVTTKAKKDKVTVKVKKTFKLSGSYTSSAKKYKIKKILGMRYESTNTKVATVTAKGVIKGVKKGTCYVYAYAQNGIAKKIKVTVKA